MKSKLSMVLVVGSIMAISLASVPAHADKYVYYPTQQVYYNPASTTYYYMDNGTWRGNTVLPTSIQLGKSVNIDLNGDIPYTYHSTVIRQYPVVTQPAPVVTQPAPPVRVKVDD